MPDLPPQLVEAAHAAALVNFRARARDGVADSPEGHATALADAVLAALFNPEHHTYWSTSCLHAWMRDRLDGDGLHDDPLHGHCGCAVGVNGPKEPHSCKWCDAQCICPCHVEEAKRGG